MAGGNGDTRIFLQRGLFGRSALSIQQSLPTAQRLSLSPSSVVVIAVIVHKAVGKCGRRNERNEKVRGIVRERLHF